MTVFFATAAGDGFFATAAGNLGTVSFWSVPLLCRHAPHPPSFHAVTPSCPPSTPQRGFWSACTWGRGLVRGGGWKKIRAKFFLYPPPLRGYPPCTFQTQTRAVDLRKFQVLGSGKNFCANFFFRSPLPLWGYPPKEKLYPGTRNFFSTPPPPGASRVSHQDPTLGGHSWVPSPCTPVGSKDAAVAGIYGPRTLLPCRVLAPHCVA